MNILEIEEAVSDLFAQPFDADEFPYAFLEAFGNKVTTIKRLRAGDTNRSDCGGVLQRDNIHIAIAPPGATVATLHALRASPATAKQKAKFILATDGEQIEAEDLASGETLACAYAELPDHFGFFLALAGIKTIRQIRDSAFDIRATSRLNQLYIQLLRDNPDWGSAARRHDMNHFMARLIFCFFAEDTDILNGDNLFTATIEQMSAADGSDTAYVIGEIFRAMNIPVQPPATRAAAGLRAWAEGFPYVNGSLFAGSLDVPRFSRNARSYLLHIGSLDWTKINPDIFGSMIQAVADDEERGTLGMHYTSVPNILKVLNPLFLDDLRAQLAAAGDSPLKLLNLRKRLARIRIFDPACGSGNFLVIAYKELRAIEYAINEKRGEPMRKSDIPLTNFRGIELRDFSAEIARLALVIAEYQCNVQYLGPMQARMAFLPLANDNWITCGNALRLDWSAICPPQGSTVKYTADDLFATPLQQTEMDFDNHGGETYICGNPPYLGSKRQSDKQKIELEVLLAHRCKKWKILDYVAGWFLKAADYCHTDARSSAAFVSTNSICQGQQVPILWPLLFAQGMHIIFAHTSFKWANLASHNAGVTVVIVGLSRQNPPLKKLYIPATQDDDNASADGQEEKQQDTTILHQTANINAYLVAGENIEIQPRSEPLGELAIMQFGNHPYYGTALIFSISEARRMIDEAPDISGYIRWLYGSQELISGTSRACLWIKDDEADKAMKFATVANKANLVRIARQSAKNDKAAQKLAEAPYRFRDQTEAEKSLLIMPRVSSENRPYLPIGLLPPNCIPQDAALALYDAPLWNMALIASRLHLVWIATVCGKLETRLRYSNTLGWNTFPVPLLTEQNKADLSECAENILLAREIHFPASIADLYKPSAMPENLRHAHERNDEIIERIYIGRRFKNDSERLEKLFALYSEMTAGKKE